MCQQRVQWAGIASNRKRRLSQCRGLCCHLAGSAAHCCGRNRLEQLRKHPAAGGSRKKWTASARFFAREICEKKCLPFRRNMGLKAREKISDHFLRFLVLVRLQGLFRKISHQVTFFFSLTAVSVELAMLSECVPSLSTKCALWKSSNALQRVLVVPAWHGALHEKNREKIEKKSHDEVLHQAWRKNFSTSHRAEIAHLEDRNLLK